MTAPIRHLTFTIEYVEPHGWPPEKTFDPIVAESTFVARCNDCGDQVRAKVDWRKLRGVIDDLVIIDAFGSNLEKHFCH